MTMKVLSTPMTSLAGVGPTWQVTFIFCLELADLTQGMCPAACVAEQGGEDRVSGGSGGGEDLGSKPRKRRGQDLIV